MLVKVKKELTDAEALGPGVRGVINPGLTEKQRKILYEYRHDMKLDPRIGLSFVPDADPAYPWLREDLLKLNLGTYKNFATPGWINVAAPHEARRDFNLPYEALRGLKERSFHFIYIPYILETVKEPLNLLRMLRDLLKGGGVAAIVIHDRDELIREGRKFEEARFSAASLETLIHDAGFSDWRGIDFRRFDLAGGDPANRGFFCVR